MADGIIRLVWSVRAFRILTGCCVIALAVLTLLPAGDMARTGLPTPLEHVIAYAGSAAIAMAGYRAERGSAQIILFFVFYAGALEYLQRFSPGRHPAVEDFIAGASGVFCGWLAIVALPARLARLLPR